MKWRHALRPFFVLLGIVFVSIFLVPLITVNADGNSLWIHSGEPTIVPEGSSAYQDIRNGIRCDRKGVTTYDTQDEPHTLEDFCMLPTPYGEIDFSYRRLFTPNHSEVW